jgi:uncharacterized delta-60 repeat protein
MNFFTKASLFLLVALLFSGVINLKAQERSGQIDYRFGTSGVFLTNDYPNRVSRFITATYGGNLFVGQSFPDNSYPKLMYYFQGDNQIRYSPNFPYLTQMHNCGLKNGTVYFGGRGYKNDTMCFYVGGYDYMFSKFAPIGKDYNGDEAPDGYELIKVGSTFSAGYDAVYKEDSSNIVIAGVAQNGDDLNLAVVDYNFEKNTYKSAQYDFGIDESAEAICWEPIIEKYYVGGYTANNTKYKFIVLRLNKDLSLDTTFGDKGKVIIDPLEGFTYGSQITDIAIQKDYKIVLAGNYQISGTQYSPVLARIKYNGDLDSTFGVNGISKPTISNSCYVNSVAVQNDLKIICGGYAKNTNDDPLVFRVNEFGDLDITFNQTGYNISDFQGGNDEITDIFIDSRGSVYAAGSVTTDVKRASVWKYTPDCFYMLPRSLNCEYGNLL